LRKKEVFEKYNSQFSWLLLKEHSYYERNDCIPKQIFGETCKSDDQCSPGLVCSSRGFLVNVCLGDLSKKSNQNKNQYYVIFT